MKTAFRPRRDFDGLEARRRRAAQLFSEGRESQASVGRLLGVSRESVRRWYDAWRGEGVAGLRKAGRGGRKPRLGLEQRELGGAAVGGGGGHQRYATGRGAPPRGTQGD